MALGIALVVDITRVAQTVLCVFVVCHAVSAINVSPRVDLPSSRSIGIAPRTQWDDEDLPKDKPRPSGVRAVLEVVVPASKTKATHVVCVGGATGCDTTTSTAKTNPSARDDDDDEPLVVVGTSDKTTKDGPDGTTKTKVFFVDEDSDEEAIRDRKTKKKDKKTSSVPVVVSYDGWAGKTEDDIPISPNHRLSNSNFDEEHLYSGLSSPSHLTVRQPHPYRTVPTKDVPVTFYDIPLGAEPLVLTQLAAGSHPSNAIHPLPQPPPRWWPSSGSNWRPRAPAPYYPGGHRPAVNRRTYPSPSPGFYGGYQPTVYNRTPLANSPGIHCPPKTPGWPGYRPVYPSPPSTSKPVKGVDGKLDFESGEEEEEEKDEKDGKKESTEATVKIIGKVSLDNWK